MKKSKLTNWASRILIGAGIVIFAFVIYQILFQETLKPGVPGARSRPRPRPAARLLPQPRPVETTAALKEAAAYLESLGTRNVEGFSAIETFSHSGHYDSWDGKVQSWWEYSDRVGETVVWRSAVLPEKEPVTLVFSGTLGTAAGEARLYVNDRPVLSFNTGVGPTNEVWEKGEYRLEFFSMLIKANRERLGIFCLTVPEEAVTPGKPLTLAVKAEGLEKSGDGNTFFMLSGSPDTLSRARRAESR